MEYVKQDGSLISLYLNRSKESQKAMQLLKEAHIKFEEERNPHVPAPCVFASEGKFRGLEGIRAFVHLRLSQY